LKEVNDLFLFFKLYFSIPLSFKTEEKKKIKNGGFQISGFDFLD